MASSKLTEDRILMGFWGLVCGQLIGITILVTLLVHSFFREARFDRAAAANAAKIQRIQGALHRAGIASETDPSPR